MVASPCIHYWPCSLAPLCSIRFTLLFTQSLYLYNLYLYLTADSYSWTRFQTDFLWSPASQWSCHLCLFKQVCTDSFKYLFCVELRLVIGISVAAECSDNRIVCVWCEYHWSWLSFSFSVLCCLSLAGYYDDHHPAKLYLHSRSHYSTAACCTLPSYMAHLIYLKNGRHGAIYVNQVRKVCILNVVMRWNKRITGLVRSR